MLQHAIHDLRDDVPSPLQDHGVAYPQILALDLGLVMQGRIADLDAADDDGFEPRDRRQSTGAADLDLDVTQDRRHLLRREFVCDRPARRA